jgi:hypothetical protein
VSANERKNCKAVDLREVIAMLPVRSVLKFVSK